MANSKRAIKARLSKKLADLHLTGVQDLTRSSLDLVEQVDAYDGKIKTLEDIKKVQGLLNQMDCIVADSGYEFEEWDTYFNEATDLLNQLEQELLPKE